MDKLRVEFHCHTAYSIDSLVDPRKMVAEARRKGIDRLIITDHNSIAGALEAQKIAPDLVIVGEEIWTTSGEFLAAYVREEIPGGLEPQEVIVRLRDQGAFISVSHPLDKWRGWQAERLLEIAPQVDALEVFNARCMDGNFNDKARAFAQEHGLPGTVGSDAHTLWELGRATLTLEPFTDADSLRQVIATGVEDVRLSPMFIHLSSRYATLAKKHHLVKAKQQPPELQQNGG